MRAGFAPMPPLRRRAKSRRIAALAWPTLTRIADSQMTSSMREARRRRPLAAAAPAAAIVATTLVAIAPARAQRPAPGSPAEAYVAVAAPVVALVGATLLDGGGGPAERARTIVIEGDRIAAVGPAATTEVPEGAEVLDLAGHTVVPGLVGLHNHLYYTAAGGRAAQLTYSAPRLYLGSGVTTVRTTGSRQPFAELNLKAEIDAGRVPGPRIHVTASYITAGGGLSTMTMLDSP